MPAMSASASIDIRSPLSRVHEVLTDFESWPSWSPWLYTEPDAKLDFVGVTHEPGHGYRWQGRKVGEGSMSLLSSDSNQIHCLLNFIKPFKSNAKVQFELTEQADASTRVTWKMDSQLPFLLFFMKGTMSAFIRSDFTRGLRLLKDYLENDAVYSATSNAGIVDVDARQFVGVAAETVMADMESSMRASFGLLMPAMKAAGIPAAGPAMAQYDHFDIKASRCRYVAGVTSSDVTDIEPPALIRDIPACRALKLTHTGRYEHLGNAWSTGMISLRADSIKASRSIKPFEIYLNDPDTTDAEHLITELYFPIR